LYLANDVTMVPVKSTTWHRIAHANVSTYTSPPLPLLLLWTHRVTKGSTANPAANKNFSASFNIAASAPRHSFFVAAATCVVDSTFAATSNTRSSMKTDAIANAAYTNPMYVGNARTDVALVDAVSR
jgi:hypothetical protein